MEIIKITPRGYCYGVVDALVLSQRAASNPDLPRPIYILGMIVHNQHVVDAIAELGIRTLDGAARLELLEEINEGTVIFTAHGVSPVLRAAAKAKGLTVLDATCPDVTRTHDLIYEKIAAGYQIVYIGKHGHPEPEGAVGIAPEQVHLIEKLEEVDRLNLTADKIVITNQTTMSKWDTEHLMKAVLVRYPHAEVFNEICMATQLRQQAVAEQANQAELCIVVGDPRSNNSGRLAQVSEEIAGVPAYRISSLEEIDPQWLLPIRKVAVTSGTSTPSTITKQVIAYLEQFNSQDSRTWSKDAFNEPVRILPPVRQLK